MSKKVVVIIKDRDRQYEGLRTSLGLLLEDHSVSMVVLDHEIDPKEEYIDNMEFIDEMDGARFSNVGKNVDVHGFKPITIEELHKLINENEIVVPF